MLLDVGADDVLAGIGTYDINEQSVNKTYLGEFASNISKTIDSGFGTTFDAHVIAGYRFLMRYYEPVSLISSQMPRYQY